MKNDKKEYRFGTIEDILRESKVEPGELDRKMEVNGGTLLTSGIHVYLPRYEINVQEGFSATWKMGLVPLNFLLIIYDKADKALLYDAEENFVDTVQEWLGRQCTLKQEFCEIKGSRKGKFAWKRRTDWVK